MGKGLQNTLTMSTCCGARQVADMTLGPPQTESTFNVCNVYIDGYNFYEELLREAGVTLRMA